MLGAPSPLPVLLAPPKVPTRTCRMFPSPSPCLCERRQTSTITRSEPGTRRRMGAFFIFKAGGTDLSSDIGDRSACYVGHPMYPGVTATRSLGFLVNGAGRRKDMLESLHCCSGRPLDEGPEAYQNQEAVAEQPFPRSVCIVLLVLVEEDRPVRPNYGNLFVRKLLPDSSERS